MLKGPQNVDGGVHIDEKENRRRGKGAEKERDGSEKE